MRRACSDGYVFVFFADLRPQHGDRIGAADRVLERREDDSLADRLDDDVLVAFVILGGEELRPGMPAEVFIQTGSRTAISYLLKPLTSQVKRAFRE